MSSRDLFAVERVQDKEGNGAEIHCCRPERLEKRVLKVRVRSDGLRGAARTEGVKATCAVGFADEITGEVPESRSRMSAKSSGEGSKSKVSGRASELAKQSSV